jgi:predicted phage tail protein
MANFDNILGDLRIVAEEVEKKTREAVELSRLRMEKIQVRSDIRKNYESIGEMVYAEYRSREDNSDVIDIFKKEIDREYDRLNEITGRIRKLRNRAQCPACGAQNEIDAAYCSHCGAEMKDGQEPVAAAVDRTAEDIKEAALGVKETLTETLETAGQYVEREKAILEKEAVKLGEKAAKLAACAEQSAKAEAEEAAEAAPETDVPGQVSTEAKKPASRRKK